MDNANSYEYLEKIKIQVLENLKRTTFAPSVQMTEVPPDPPGMDDEADAILDDLDEDENKDKRHTKRRWDKYVEKVGELSDSDDEEENDNNGVRRDPNMQKRRNLRDYPNPNAPVYENDSGAPSPQPAGSQEGDMADLKLNGNSGMFEKKSGSMSPPPAKTSAESSPGSQVDSPPPDAVEEQDVEMADEPPVQVAAPPPELLVNGAQEKTPPESPEAAGVTAPVSIEVNSDANDDPMEEAAEAENLPPTNEPTSSADIGNEPAQEPVEEKSGSPSR